MSSVFRLAAISLALWLSAVPSWAGINTWSSEGPYGGSVVALAQDAASPLILYAASAEAGMWKSLDGGESWQAISDGFARNQRQILALAAHPSAPGTLLIRTSFSTRLFRSVDGGTSWEDFGQGLNPQMGVRVLEYAPSDGETVYLGSSQGVWVSHDGGASWQPTGTEVADRFIVALAVHPADPLAAYAADGEGDIFATTDGGTSWQLVSQDLPVGLPTANAALAIDPQMPQTLYAAVRERLYKSPDGGMSWIEHGAELGERIFSVAVDPEAPERLFIGTLLGNVYSSTDGGTTWAAAIFPHDPSEVVDFAFGAPGTTAVYLADRRDGGVFRSDDGLTWQPSNRGLAAARVESFTADPVGGMLYAAATNGVHRRPLDPGLGEGWKLLVGSRSLGDCCNQVLVEPGNPHILYASGNSSQILRSFDGGETWSMLDLGDASGFRPTAFVMDPESPTTLYVGNALGVWKSIDRGATWQASAMLDEPVELLAFDPFDPDHLVAATTRETHETFDDGATWSRLGNAPGAFPTAMFFDPLVPGALYGATSSEVTRSLSGGATWFALGTDGLPPARALETLVLDPRDQTTLYVGTIAGLYHSTDGGTSWSPFEGGVDPDRWVVSLLVDPGPPTTFHAGTFRNSAHSLTRGCIDSPSVLCLDRQAGDKRFAVSIDFDTALGGGLAGEAEATSLNTLGIEDGGIFSFFVPENPEALVKVVDACGFNGRFWVFAAATTSVGFDLKVEDTLAREQWTASNPDDHPAESIADTEAFATCDVESFPSRTPLARSVASARQVAVASVRPVSPRDHETDGCVADATTLCIDDAPGDGRFAIRLHFDSQLGGGVEGDAMATPLAPLGITDGGILSFFDVSLPEVLVKMVDGCDFNGNYWLFYAATTNLGFSLSVEDTHTGATKTYTNPDGMIAQTITDIEAFATCSD